MHLCSNLYNCYYYLIIYNIIQGKGGCCLTLLPPPVGGAIMRYESETISYYRWLINCSYTIF